MLPLQLSLNFLGLLDEMSQLAAAASLQVAALPLDCIFSLMNCETRHSN